MHGPTAEYNNIILWCAETKMKFVGHGLSVYVLLQLVIYSEESYHIASCIYINSILWLLFTLNKLQNLINRLVMNCSMNIFVSIYLSMYLSMLGTCAESCKNATSRTIHYSCSRWNRCHPRRHATICDRSRLPNHRWARWRKGLESGLVSPSTCYIITIIFVIL